MPILSQNQFHLLGHSLLNDNYLRDNTRIDNAISHWVPTENRPTWRVQRDNDSELRGKETRALNFTALFRNYLEQPDKQQIRWQVFKLTMSNSYYR